jgi:hypothetical protein
LESEKDTEKYLRNEIKRIGGIAYKFVSPGNAGVPDRIVCLNGGETIFVELKSEGKRSTVLQQRQQERLRNLGFEVYTDVDTKSKVDELIRKLKNEV